MVAHAEMDVLRQQAIEQATCSVCLEIRVPIYACGAGCGGVTCGSCRAVTRSLLPGFDYNICPSCRGKRNLALERFVATLKLAETAPMVAQPAPTQKITPGPAAAVSRTRARATGYAGASGERKEIRRAGSTGRGSTGRGSKRCLERRSAGRKRALHRPAASAVAATTAAAAAAAAAATASGAAAADLMKLCKADGGPRRFNSCAVEGLPVAVSEDNSHDLIMATKTNNNPCTITKADLMEYYHLSREDAACQLGIGCTCLKKVCRRFGITRWPCRKLQALNNHIDGLSKINSRSWINDPVALQLNQAIDDAKDAKKRIYEHADYPIHRDLYRELHMFHKIVQAKRGSSS